VGGALEGLEGVRRAEVDFYKGIAIVTYDRERVGSEQMVRALEKYGYRARVLEQRSRAPTSGLKQAEIAA